MSAPDDLTEEAGDGAANPIPDAEAAAGSVPPDTAAQPPPREMPRASAATRVLAALALIAALWWGQRFVVPLVAGLLLAMLVMPFTLRLQAIVRSAAVATLITLALVVGTLAAAAAGFGGQLLRVAERMPEMISMVAQQMSDRDPSTSSLLMRARDALRELDRAATGMMAPKAPPPRAQRRAQVAPAVAVAASAAPITEGAAVALKETAVTGSGALLAFAGTLSIVLFIAFFVLLGGRPLQDRFLGLWGGDPEVHARAQHAMRECARQVRLYAGVLLVTNTAIGIAVWIAFWLAGLPDAAGWGVTAAVLHVVPYFGMALLTGLGAAEAFLAHSSLGAALGMAAFVVALSTFIGTLVTAWLQGRAARMSPAAVFIGLVFWGALWGLWGLFLGPVLIVLMKVVAEHTHAGARLAELMRG